MKISQFPSSAASVRHMGSRRQLVSWAILATVLASAPPRLSADQIVWNQSISTGVVGFSLPQFDPAYGRLTSVDTSFSGGWQTLNGVYNPTITGISFTATWSSLLTVGVPGTSLSDSYLMTGNFDGYAAPMALTQGPRFIGYNLSLAGGTSLAADLDFFTGANSVTFSI